MKIALIQWLFLFWMILKEALQNKPRTYHLVFTEGEVYFHDFASSFYLNPEGKFSISHSDTDTNKNRTEYNSLEFRNKSFNASVAKQKVEIKDFERYTCIPKPFGNVTDLAIVYERSTNKVTTGQGKYFIQFKRIEYGNTTVDPAFYYPEQTIKDVTEIDMNDYIVQSSSCKQEIVINEFKRVLFICQSITHNQYFVLSICSDSTCNEQTESLKIKDYTKGASFENINVKEMPGIDERTFSLIIWFEGLEYLEYLLIDEVGKMESQVFKMDFNIKKIRYFSGQFLSFESFNEQRKPTYYFMFFDFGVKRLDFNKAKPKEMLNFGNFVNSYVNSINGEIIVELLDKDMLLDMSLRRQTGEFMIEYSKKLFKPEESKFDSASVFIFEVGGDYQLVIENNILASSPSRGSIFKRFKVVNRFESVESGSNNPFNQTVTNWKKVSGFGKLIGCSIEKYNKSDTSISEPDFVISMRDIHLAEPYARLDIPNIIQDSPPKTSVRSAFKVFEQHRSLQIKKNWTEKFDKQMNISGYQNKSDVFENVNYVIIKRTGFLIGYKECILENTTIQINSSGTTSDEIYPLKNIIRGNLIPKALRTAPSQRTKSTLCLHTGR